MPNKKVLKQKQFPELLREIPKLPDKIYVIGDLPESDKPVFYISIIGTRKFSEYGKCACERIIKEIAEQKNNIDVVIVSGIALGIDAIAHRAALKNNLKTIAVPGSGLDFSVFHPRTNHGLARDIIESGGCLLSEFDWEMPAAVYMFPQRNRIVAGLSHATFVIEAPERSGALITADFALDFNRDVCALPGSIFSENSSGTNKLIKAGATPVTAGTDILKTFELYEEIEEGSPAVEMENLTENEKKILSLLGDQTDKDELLRRSGLSIVEANTTLTSMQLKGLIKEFGGNIYRI